MIRADIKCLEKHKKAKPVKPETVTYYKSLPLLAYPTSKEGIEGINNFIKTFDAEVFPVPHEEYPFNEFMFQPFHDEAAHIQLEDQGESIRFSIKYYTGNKQTPLMYSGIITVTVSNSTADIKIVSGQESAKKRMRKLGQLPPKDDADLEESLKEGLYTVSVRLMALISYARAKDLYPVIVESKHSTKKKGGIKNSSPSKEKTGPRVIYLNVLPTKRVLDHREDLPLPVDSSGKRPHARRGFWKTLRSERFKNHPLYMVPNAIRVRPAWIGDKTKVIDGNIYTVLIKDQ